LHKFKKIIILYLPITLSWAQQILLQTSLDETESLEFSSTSCNGHLLKHVSHANDEHSHGPDEKTSSCPTKKEIC